MAKKINKNELEQIQDFAKRINNGTNQLGQIEVEKHSLLHALNTVQNDLAVFQKELKEKYGDVKVNLQTGKIESNIIE